MKTRRRKKKRTRTRTMMMTMTTVFKVFLKKSTKLRISKNSERRDLTCLKIKKESPRPSTSFRTNPKSLKTSKTTLKQIWKRLRKKSKTFRVKRCPS
jgi:hypothetical protein